MILLRFCADDNTWDGRPNPPLRSDRLTSCVRHGTDPWVPVRMHNSSSDDVLKEFEIQLTDEITQVCNVVPYTETDLSNLLRRVEGNPDYRKYPIGETVEKRPL